MLERVQPQHPKYCSEKGEIITPVSEISSAYTICCIFITAVREVVSVSIVFEELLMKTPLLLKRRVRDIPRDDILFKRRSPRVRLWLHWTYFWNYKSRENLDFCG